MTSIPIILVGTKMETSNTNQPQNIDDVLKAIPVESEAASLVGNLSRADSLVSIIGDAASTSMSLPIHMRNVKRKRKGTPKHDLIEDESDIDEPTKIDPDIEQLRKERSELEAFLFTDTNKVNKVAIKYILNKWATLEGKVQYLIIENRKLEAKLTAVESAAIASSKSYAETVAGGHLHPSGSGMAPETKKRRDQSKGRVNEVILIRPMNTEDARTNDQIRASLTKQLEPVRGKLKIKNIRQTRQKGLLIEVNSKEDVRIIKNGSLDKVGLKTEEPKKLNPSIIIYDVEKEHPIEQLKNDFIEKNFSYDTEEDKNKMLETVNFKNKFLNKAGRHNWIIQVPGRRFTELMKQDRIFMCWRAYRFNEYVNVTRCYKCQGYGHIAKYCNAPDQLCEHCGSKEHTRENCPEKGTPKCINCRRTRRPNFNHWVKSKECPEYLRQVDIYNKKVEWG